MKRDHHPDAFDRWLGLFGTLVVEPIRDFVRAAGRMLQPPPPGDHPPRRKRRRRRRGGRV